MRAGPARDGLVGRSELRLLALAFLAAACQQHSVGAGARFKSSHTGVARPDDAGTETFVG